MILGLLSLRLEQETDYFTEIAKRAHSYNAKVVRFTPASIHPATELVRGFIFQDSEWKESTFPIPPFIYDRCFYTKTAQATKAKPIVAWLKHRPNTSFLGHGLPDKLRTYELLSKDEQTSPYVPPSTPASEAAVTAHMKKHKNVVIKPIHGSGGSGFCYMFYSRGGIQIMLQNGKSIMKQTFRTEEEWSAWLRKLLSYQAYMLQPFLSIQDYYKRPFDIRILLQKDAHGMWSESGRGVRIGERGSLVSNLYAGSTIVSYDEWKRLYPKRDILLLEDNISTILTSVPAALEKELPPLFELGLDISVDGNKAAWLLDVNSKPGRKVLLTSSPACAERLYSAPLAYCSYLASAKKERI